MCGGLGGSGGLVGWWLVGGVLLLVRVCFRSRTPSDLRVCVLEGVLGGCVGYFLGFFLGALTCGFVLFGRACGGLCPTFPSAFWLTVVVPPRGTPGPHTASGRQGETRPEVAATPKPAQGPARALQVSTRPHGEIRRGERLCPSTRPSRASRF